VTIIGHAQRKAGQLSVRLPSGARLGRRGPTAPDRAGGLAGRCPEPRAVRCISSL